MFPLISAEIGLGVDDVCKVCVGVGDLKRNDHAKVL